MTWRRFVLQLLLVFFGGSFALFAVLALLDPWGTLPFASPLPRVPADHSQRWAYPELARDPRFDSAIIGDSTSRLLDPADLDPAVGGRLVNLAMVHSFPWEQMRLFDVFLSAHPVPRTVLIGLDRPWCDRGDDQEHYGYDPLPDWLYDGDRAAALRNLLNLHAVETAWRSLQAVLGLSPRPYGANGWELIDVDYHRYDPALARKLLDEGLAEWWPPAPDPDPAKWHYVAFDWLRQRLERLPAGTRKLLVFVPRYHLYPPPDGPGPAMIAECKRRAVALASQLTNAEVYDMAFPNRFTTEDDHWWDVVHLRPEAMAEVSRELAGALAGREEPSVHVLYAPPGGSASASVR